MLTTFAMVGPFILFAWMLQYCLNHLIAEDVQSFNYPQANPAEDPSLT
ncbi:MAG: hypothetical protein AAF282_19480 [Cyanobacteria bacterium P01_A01_bin.15]